MKPIADPVDIAIEPKRLEYVDVPVPYRIIDLPTMNPGERWLLDYEMRAGRKNLDPYVTLDTTGKELVLREGLSARFPAQADSIRRDQLNGMRDEEIVADIKRRINIALEAGISDEEIARHLFAEPHELSLYRKTKEYAQHVLIPDKILSYTSWAQQEKQYRNTRARLKDELERTRVDAYYANKRAMLVNDIAAVTAAAFSGLTFGLGNVLLKKAYGPEQVPKPETTVGTIGAAGAGLAAFILGPYRAAAALWGSAGAPTAIGLRGVAEIMIKGGATLGTATFLADIVPALDQSETLVEAGLRLINDAGMATLAGSLYPVAGAIESKALRVAVGMAVLDVMRSGPNQWFTIDDVYAGIKAGTIDKQQLAERSFGYLLDLYFLSRVPTMRSQLQARHHNQIVNELLAVNGTEAENLIIALGREGLIPGVSAESLQGLSHGDIQRQWGGIEGFRRAYRALSPEQVRAAKTILEAHKAYKGGELLPAPQAVLKEQAGRLIDAMKVERMYNESDVLLQALYDGNAKRIRRTLATLTYDTSANVKRELLKNGGAEGKDAVIHHTLSRGATPRSNYLIRQASSAIYGGLSKAEHTTLDRIIQSRRTIAIHKYLPQHRRPGGLTGEQHQQYLDSLPQEVRDKLMPRADAYFKTMKQQLDMLKAEALLDQKSYDNLVSRGDYERSSYIQHIDPVRGTKIIGGRKITVRDSGIPRFEEGSTQVLETNSQKLMAEVILRTQARILRNRANQSLWHLAQNHPGNGIVQPAKIVRHTKTGKPVYQKTPHGYETVHVMLDGKPEQMLMPTELAAEWTLADPMVKPALAEIVGWLSGAKILRPMATGYNPEFAITNMPRDMAYGWLRTQEWSSTLPLAAGQMARDYGAVAADVIARKGRYVDYIMEGGGMSFLTHQGGGGRKGARTGVWGTLEAIGGYVGETSELWTRLALRERALRNGAEPHEATFVARNYLDFAQGGSAAKAFDTAIPYFNAGIQGTKGIVQSAAEHPALFTYKVAQLGALSMGLYWANSRKNPEAWEGVSDYDRANYWIITQPYPIQDTDGETRYAYARIAKDHTQKLFCTIFEGIAAKAVGDPINVDEILIAAEELATILPATHLPPTMNAFIGYLNNRDLWYREDIWRKDIGPHEPEVEIYPSTHPLAVEAGRAMGMSPARLEWVVQQFTTRSNIFTDIVGGGLRQIMDELPQDVRDKTYAEMVRQMPFLRRGLRLTEPYNEFRKQNEDIRKQENTERYRRTQEIDGLTERYLQGEIGKKEVQEFIRAQEFHETDRLFDRFLSYQSYHDIPNRRWWVDLSTMGPEAAAQAYWARYQHSTAEQRQALDSQLRKLRDPSIMTERFMLRLNKLKKSGEFK